MVGIGIDDDVIIGPIPIVAIGQVKRRHTKVIAAEPEAVGTASAEPPYETRAKSALEVAVFPGVVEVVVDTWAVYIVADPLTILMDVRGFGMAFLVAESRVVSRRLPCVLHRPANIVVGGRWSAARNVAAADPAGGFIVTRGCCGTVFVLRQSWNREDQRDSDQ